MEQILAVAKDLKEVALTLLGALVGALIALAHDRWLERHRIRREAAVRGEADLLAYGKSLSRARYGLSLLQSTCLKLEAAFTPGALVFTDIAAPGLSALIASPEFQHRASHGFTTVALVLHEMVLAAANVLDFYRQAAATGLSLTETGVKDIVWRLTELRRGIYFIQDLLDAELLGLGLGVLNLPEDQKTIDQFNASLKGEFLGPTAQAAASRASSAPSPAPR